MPIQTFGDMSQHYQSLRQTGVIKTRLASLSNQLSSGVVADVTSHLGGDTAGYALLNRDIGLLETYRATSYDVVQTLDQMQTSLQGLDGIRGRLSDRFLLISADSSAVEVADSATMGREGFKDMVAILNRRLGDRSLFAGAAVDQIAVADAETMLASLVAAIGGATNQSAIETIVSDWFNDPAGGFTTSGYLGDTGANPRRAVSDIASIEVDGRADDPAIREVLGAAALAAVADVLTGSLDARTTAGLVKSSGAALLSAATPLTYLQGRIGETEGHVAAAATENAAKLSTFRIARSDLVSADPFETATQLQDVQRQLETHFAVTARLSRLSLSDYLR